MTVQYEINGDIFLEISSNWLCAYANEFLIKARQLDTDLAGNTIENLQLNDGRMFTRLVPGPRTVSASKAPYLRPRNMQLVIREPSVAHPR